MQLQCRKVDNVEKEGNRHSGDAPKGNGFKGGWKCDIRERIFQFTAKTIPIPRIRNNPVHNNRETFQTTERESENGK